MKTPAKDTRFELKELKPGSMGRLELSFKLGWLIGLGLTAVLGAAAGFIAEQPLLALGWIVLVGVFYLTFLERKPGASEDELVLLTKVSKRAVTSFYHRIGWGTYVSDEPELGEWSNGAGRRVTPPRPPSFSKILGRFDYSYAPDDPTVGTVRDRLLSTQSATVWLTPSSLAGVSYEQMVKLIEGYGRLLSGFDPASSLVYRYSWKIFTDLGEPIDPDELADAVGRPHRMCADRQVFDEVTRSVTRDSPRRLITMTVTGYRPHMRDEARRSGGYENVLLQEVYRLQDRLNGLGLHHHPMVCTPLSRDMLIEFTRFCIDPVFVGKAGTGMFQPRAERNVLDEAHALPRWHDLSTDPSMAWIGSTFWQFYQLRPRTNMTVGLEDFTRVMEAKTPCVHTVVQQPVGRHKAIKSAELLANVAYSNQEEDKRAGGRVSGRNTVAAETSQQDEKTLLTTSDATLISRHYVAVYGEAPDECTIRSTGLFEAVGRVPALTVEPIIGDNDQMGRVLLPISAGTASRAKNHRR